MFDVQRYRGPDLLLVLFCFEPTGPPLVFVLHLFNEISKFLQWNSRFCHLLLHLLFRLSLYSCRRIRFLVAGAL